ncbi:MAG: DUF3343 domain-containing protein [Synergistaceae bacterium]|nr:DUF3343 domain-containing protein [Synergistaceae bacterium]
MHYILFPDVTNAQRLYDLMKAAGIKCTFAPTPREADKCCGVSVLYYDDSDNAAITGLIRENNISVLKFFEGKSGNPDRLKFC